MSPITHTSNQPAEYADALSAAKTLTALQSTVLAWKALAPDAVVVVSQMDLNDFQEWRNGLAKERADQFAGEDFAAKYGALMMPELMFKVSMIAVKFHVPWGCAYIRLKETGKL